MADFELTGDQGAAFKQHLDAVASPYSVSALCGTHGKRLLQKRGFTTFYLQPDDTWQKRELPGPLGFDNGWQSWRVLRTSLLLFGAVDPEHLDNYGEHIMAGFNRYREQFGFIIYTSDVRMRSEYF